MSIRSKGKKELAGKGLVAEKERNDIIIWFVRTANWSKHNPQIEAVSTLTESPTCWRFTKESMSASMAFPVIYVKSISKSGSIKLDDE